MSITETPTSITESRGRSFRGIPWLLADVVLLPAAVACFVVGGVTGTLPVILLGIPLALAFIVVLLGFYMIQPNQSAVLTLFGDYRGSDREPGLRWANPLYMSKKVSLRVRNFTTETSKVNDARGNPIEIAAVVVWRVVDTARATFGVDNFTNYVHIQSESAVRQLARSYPYDAFEEHDVTTLIGDTGEINHNLEIELQERADDAGVEVIETRITDLAYAPEIAEAMLRRQQAAAIVAARAKIVEGAVLMVREAIEALEEGSDEHDSIPLDSDRKATFASNLMTVIASDQPTNPVVNVGTLNR
ncbi:MAG: SPFH domain-containing protein [Ilumatobacter sp.]|uniref:SPFH domain-containing protein n=1 Tax=Ilumatobacter sp. TaxID=1967498 RepID=UPI00261EAC02|nr:SPFH domain-containing protein [Ilumatobacter sp.]MDJ0767157.1 SPFH domain-containing protein [Ilumatobacter sp.]